MDPKLATLGYELGPSKYSPALGYSGLSLLISGRPTERLFDVKTLRVPTFDGRWFHQTQISRHELEMAETFQVVLGQLSLETYRGEHIRAFSFGGVLRATLKRDDLYCEFTSNAPIFRLQEATISVGGVVADEIMDLLAEKQVTLTHHEDELYSRLAKFEPYPLFLACLVSLQKRVDSVPLHQRHEKFQKLSSNLKRAIQIVRDSDGWDGHSPSLEDLLTNGGA
jgi:hypothetical protein